jgi:hypothetical protein
MIPPCSYPDIRNSFPAVSMPDIILAPYHSLARAVGGASDYTGYSKPLFKSFGIGTEF